MEEGYLPGIDLDTATFTFWSVAHGVASLAVRNRTPLKASTDKLTDDAIDFFMDLVSAKCAVSSDEKIG
jgi:hypothetical protein